MTRKGRKRGRKHGDEAEKQGMGSITWEGAYNTNARIQQEYFYRGLTVLVFIYEGVGGGSSRRR